MRRYTALISGALFWAAAAAPVLADAQAFERLYGELLATYWHAPVRIHGIETTVFDYRRMAADARRPDALFERVRAALRGTDPGRLGAADAKAFWINAYNFGAMRLVVDHYPVDSIRSPKISLLGYPWSRTAVVVGGEGYSLNDIEKTQLLARFGDPRIVFGVSCAAVSCPDRMPEAFTAARLDRQLDDLIRRFFANPTKGAALDRGRRVLTLSWILKKDAGLFPEERGGVLGFVRPYLPAVEQAWLRNHAVTLQYFDHDWTLNDLAQAD